MGDRLTSIGFALALGLAACPPASAVTIDWVEIGAPGNAADPDPTTDNCGPSHDQGCGAVARSYSIGKYEVTNAQYAEFLNAVAATDTHLLYDGNMGLDATFGGITRSGTSGSYTYAVKPDFENKPVVYVSLHDAARFSNWLQHGQPVGLQTSQTTEDGAYTLTSSDDVVRNANAIVFLPNGSEWYKAAYYDTISNAYFDYPAGFDVAIGCSTPTATPNRANCDSVVGTLTDVGSYAGSASPSGTFDQGGNVREWIEEIDAFDPGFATVRGGSLRYSALATSASFTESVGTPFEDFDRGFRVARVVPEPATAALVAAGVAGLTLVWQRRISGPHPSALNPSRPPPPGRDGRSRAPRPSAA